MENLIYPLSADGYSQNRKVRPPQLATTSYSSELKNIKTKLLRVFNNTEQVGYTELRELRKQYYRLSLQREKFSSLDSEESALMKKLFVKLRQTHPEICSKQQFVESKSLRSSSQPSSSRKQATTFDRPSSEPLSAYPNQSQNLLSSFIAYHSQPLHPAELVSEASERKRANKPSESFRDSSLFTTQNMRESEQTPVADNVHVEMPTEEKEEEVYDVEAKVHQYKRWADELYKALEEQYPGR